MRRLLILVAVLAAGCGGGARQDADEPSGEFKVEIVDASFPRVQHIAGTGVTHVIECGPGKVLAGLTKRIDGNLVGASVFDPASLDEALKLATA